MAICTFPSSLQPGTSLEEIPTFLGTRGKSKHKETFLSFPSLPLPHEPLLPPLPGGLASPSAARVRGGSGLLQGAEGITAPRCPALPPPCPTARSPCLPGAVWLPARSLAFYPHPLARGHFAGHFAPQAHPCNVFAIAGFAGDSPLQPKVEENAVASSAAQGASPGASREACPEPRAHPEPVCKLLMPGMGEPRGLAQAASRASWGYMGQRQPL